MNQTNTAIELKNATRRILRWRFPLIIALLANIGMVARTVTLPGGAEASQPAAATVAFGHRSPLVDVARHDQPPQPTLPTVPLATERPSTPSVPVNATTFNAADFVPDLTLLAARWWPTIESTAEAAAQLAAAHLPLNGELTVSNVQQNGLPVTFLVDGRVYTLHPGESHMFPAGTAWNLQFHRGGTFGTTQQALTPGAYQFVVDSTGWSLQPSR